MRTDICTDLHIDMRMDMHTDLCIDMHTGMHIDRHMDVRIDIWADMPIDNSIGRCTTDTFIGMCIDMCVDIRRGCIANPRRATLDEELHDIEPLEPARVHHCGRPCV